MFPYFNSYNCSTPPVPVNTPGFFNGQFVGNPSPTFGWNTPQPVNYTPWPVNSFQGAPFMGYNGFNNFNTPGTPGAPVAGFSPWNTPQIPYTPQISPTNTFVGGWNWNYAPAAQNWTPNIGQPQPTPTTFVGQPTNQIPSPSGNVPPNQGWVPAIPAIPTIPTIPTTPFGFVPANFTGAPAYQTPPVHGAATNNQGSQTSSNGQPPVGIHQAA